MMMLGRQGAEVPSSVNRGNAKSNKNTRSETTLADISLLDEDDNSGHHFLHDDSENSNDANDAENSARSQNDLDELLLEAGFSGRINAPNVGKNDALITKSKQRLRTFSSSSSFAVESITERSYVTANSPEGEPTEHDELSNCDIDIHDNPDQDRALPLGTSQDRSLCLLPAPEHDSEIPSEHQQIQDDVVPVISMCGLQILPPKKDKPAIETTPPTETNLADHDDASTSTVASHDHQPSVTSVQSLISVVAELVSIPIRIITAALADLQQEAFASAAPARAEFLSATVFVSNNNQGDETSTARMPLGLQLDRSPSNGSSSGCSCLVISDIDPQGPWAVSPLRVGDRILSINHVRVSDWQVDDVIQYWEALQTDTATIVAHNLSGDAQWVEVMITKPDSTCRTGLGMRSSRPGRIKISRVGGLFTDSLLTPGDQLLSINGTYLDGYTSSETANLILQSPRYVTVVAKSDARSAFVIAGNSSSSSLNPLGRMVTDGIGGSESMNRNNNGQSDEQVLLRGSCDSCGRPCTPLKSFELVGNVYVLIVLFGGIYLCLAKHTRLSFIMGVFVLCVVMSCMIKVTIQQLHQQVHDMRNRNSKTTERCSLFQLSFNAILTAAFTILLMLWGNLRYEAITTELVLGLVSVVFAPMLFFVNLPSFLPSSMSGVQAGTMEHDDHEGFEADGEHEAIASLAELP